MIGYYGCPPRALLARHAAASGASPVDLDIDAGYPDPLILPRTTCQIIKNIIANAVRLRGQLSLIIASVGPEKCDGGRYAAQLLAAMGFRVIEAEYEQAGPPGPVKIALSGLPLREKIIRIMDTVHTASREAYPPVAPRVGFWGVPPSDMRILDLFPDDTHVYGWTRCVEARAPADAVLEWYVDPAVPTVFYAQGFCQKAALARFLAERHSGLFVDAVERHISASTRAKIEAFLWLRAGVGGVCHAAG